MEDALALVKGLLPKKLQDVLILVLMEDALAQQVAKLYSVFNSVLILVLMEDALALVDCDIEEVHKVCVLILVLMEDALAPDTILSDNGVTKTMS